MKFNAVGLERIKDVNKVNCIKEVFSEGKLKLVAELSNNEDVALTDVYSNFFRLSPFNALEKIMGRGYLSHFSVERHGVFGVNKENIVGVREEKSDSDITIAILVADFKDGSSSYLMVGDKLNIHATGACLQELVNKREEADLA